MNKEAEVRESKKILNIVLSVFGWFWVVLWYLFSFSWPLLRWFVSFYVFVKFLGVFILWGASDSYPVFEFLGVMGLAVILEYFARFYIPSKLERAVSGNEQSKSQ